MQFSQSCPDLINRSGGVTIGHTLPLLILPLGSYIGLVLACLCLEIRRKVRGDLGTCHGVLASFPKNEPLRMPLFFI
jgi:hypothetical protein